MDLILSLYDKNFFEHAKMHWTDKVIIDHEISLENNTALFHVNYITAGDVADNLEMWSLPFIMTYEGDPVTKSGLEAFDGSRRYWFHTRKQHVRLEINGANKKTKEILKTIHGFDPFMIITQRGKTA